MKAFDEMYSNTVAIRSSYTFEEIVYGAKFVPMFENSEGSKTVLHVNKLNLFAEIPFVEQFIEA